MRTDATQRRPSLRATGGLSAGARVATSTGRQAARGRRGLVWVVVSIMGIGLAAGVGDRPIAVVAEDAIEVEPDIEIVDGPVPVPFARPAIARTNSGSTSDLPGAELKTNPENDRLLDRAEKFVERGRFDLASVLWQRVLDTSADSMMTHDDWVDQTVIQKHKYRRYRSVATEIESRLARLKPAALKTYRITADGEAKALLSAAGQERREEALARIVRRFFLSSLGDDAAYELACLALDRHDFVGAGRLLAKILEEYPDSSIPRDEVLLRFAVAQASVGDAQSATAALDEIDRLPNRSTTRAARQAVRAYLDERGPAAVASARRSWPMAFGSAERDGAMPALPSEQADQPLEPIWRLSFDPDKAAISGQTVKGKAFTYDPTDGLLSASGEINFALRSQLISRWKQAPGQVPTGHVLFDGGRIYHKTPKALFCFDAETGRMLWRSRSFTFAPDSLSPYFARFKGQINAAHIPSSTAERLLLLDRVNPGMAISDGRIYAITGALKDDPPMAGGGTQRRHYVSIPKRARHNRLTALDARTGKLLWRRTAHDPTPKPGEQLRRHVGFMGAPVPYGRLLLIPVTDNGTLWLYALDATTGGKVWKTYLCEEPSGGASPWSPVAVSVSGGDAYVSTGVGVVFAVGAMSGEVRWAVRYPRAGNMASGSRRSYPRVSGMLLKPGGFIADVVIPYGKALVVIPSDFDHLFAIDRRTGEFLWDSPLGVMGEVRSVIGASAGRLYLASHDVVRCIEMQTGRRVWGDTKEQKVGGILGRGCVTSDAVYVPVSSPEGGASGKFQTHLVRLSLEDGRELSRSPVTTPEGDPLGNLYCDGERVYAAALHRLYALGTADFRLNLLKDLADSGDTDAQESTLRILSRSGRYEQVVDRLLAQHAAELKKVSRPDDISPSERLYRAAEEFDLVKHSPAAALRLLAAGHRQRPLTPDEEPARDLWELRGRILFAALRAAADEMAGDAADVRLERVLEVLPLCTQLHEQWAARSAALAAAGRQGAQGAKALRSLLDSGSATDRLVATALVELDKDADAAEITPLAEDKDHRVALAAGFAALKSGDRRGLDWLAGLLTAEEQLVRAQAAELLTAATGRSLGYSAFAEKIDRAAKAAAWKKWIEQNGAAVKLQPLPPAPSMIAGRTLLWNDTRNEVVELGPGGEALWRQTVINPWTGQLLPSGGRLIGTNARALIEFDISGRIVWREDALPGEPRGVLRTRGGKTWVTIPSRNLLLRYRSDGTVDLKRTIEGDPRGLALAADGNVLIALQKAGRIAKLDDAGEMVWKLDGVSSVDSLKELAGGNLLVCQRSLTGSLNRVVELTPGGEEVWSTSEVRSPYAAHRLPSGETVVVDLEGIHRFDADGKRISQERERGYRGASWQ